jgi:hypothetical protein
MTIELLKSPFPVTYRELWLPSGIRANATMPSSIYNGHALTLTGAQKRTTVDGVRGNGTNTSNINCGALHNASAKLWVSLRFKLNIAFAAGAAADQYIWGKYSDADNYIYAWLENADGKLYFKLRTTATDRFTVSSVATTWAAGTWYHLLFSISSVNAVRMRINNGTAVTDPNTNALPNGGDLCFLDYDDPGAGTGFKGVIADIFVGTDDLTTTEEADLYKGTPPDDVVNEYLLDEGRGVTAYDQGSGANNGTLDTSATWAWGQCRQVVLGMDGINNRAATGYVGDIGGNTTHVWVGKMKSTYNAISVQKTLYYHYNLADSLNCDFNSGTNALRFRALGAGASGYVDYTVKPSIDDYNIFLFTVVNGVSASLFANGQLYQTVTGNGVISRAAAAFWFGADAGGPSPGRADISKPLLVGLIEGALTAKQALAYSRYLRNIFNLPITI